MKIIVNGQDRTVMSDTLDAALAELGYGDGKVATAVNETFVPATGRAGHGLSDGDRLEIVAPRQGG